ncbi:hypothetical protein V8J88_10850 [Massilia sp. W12]|uniref:hypothetical protein n=1 Tax=Massilia sp. W12 TaxID=3126507 RepID=UPI0030D13014
MLPEQICKLQEKKLARREKLFEELWNASNSEYSRAREITEFIKLNGGKYEDVLVIPSECLADLLKLLSRNFFLGMEDNRFGCKKSVAEKFILENNLDIKKFESWCKQDKIFQDGAFLGMQLDIWGVLMDRE